MSYVRDASFEGPLMLRDFDDVAYHLGLRTDGDPVGDCVRDFQQWYGRPMWGMVEELLGVRPPLRMGGKNEYAAIKMTWLRDRVRHIPADGSADTLTPARSSHGVRLFFVTHTTGYAAPVTEPRLILPSAHHL
ncbi:hypothetical protein PIB30_073280 [Stylosanthes scabra]|uniref:Uncharacterized protein n=1 Tax=Stylosanthes scabra TaxID=79078 RepID=A0ABU6YQN6_9FABA|nr:hypothetical protein [Stylosanthes scabra]